MLLNVSNFNFCFKIKTDKLKTITGTMGGDEELLDCWAPSLVSGSVALPGALTGSQVMLVLVVWGPLR